VRLVAGPLVKRADVADQVEGGPGAVAGDEQVPAAPGRDLGDRGVQDFDVVCGGVVG
jgi:hypothetical protein